MRSPLTAILGYIELIQRSGQLNQQQAEFIRRVQLSVGQITDLVSNLLDLGRIEAGLDTAKEKTPVSVLARYALEGMRSNAKSKGLRLNADLPDDLPMVLGAPIRLRQMIGNLLDNAIKYTPPGGQILIEARSEGIKSSSGYRTLGRASLFSISLIYSTSSFGGATFPRIFQAPGWACRSSSRLSTTTMVGSGSIRTLERGQLSPSSFQLRRA